MDIYYDLRTHPLFKNFSENMLIKLSEKFREFRCDEGAVIYYEKDGCDSLYIFMEGEFCASNAGCEEKSHFLPGDFTDPEKLLGADYYKDTLICRTPGKFLKIERKDFLDFANSLKKNEREFTALFDDQKRRISGFDLNMNLRSDSEPEKMSIFKWRRSSFYLFEKIFYPLMTLLAIILFSSSTFSFPYDFMVYRIVSAGICLYSIFAIILWLSEKFVLNENNISALKISFKPLGIKRNILPLDQIRGIKIEKKRLKNRFFNIGSLLIQTSSGTVLKLSDIDKPKKVQKIINDFLTHSQKQSTDRERVEIRKKMESYFESSEKIHSKEEMADSEIPIEESVFRKSLFFLIASIWWQVAVAGGLYTFAYIFRDSNGFLIALPSFPFIFILLWRVQDWRNDLYKVSGGKIIDINKKPFGKSESNNLADIGYITNIRSERKGFLQYLFNYGDVVIETAGGSITFETVTAPLEVQARLLQVRQSWKQKELEKNRDRQFQDFLVYSEIYKQADEQNRIGRSTPPLAEDPHYGVKSR